MDNKIKTLSMVCATLNANDMGELSSFVNQYKLALMGKGENPLAQKEAPAKPAKTKAKATAKAKEPVKAKAGEREALKVALKETGLGLRIEIPRVPYPVWKALHARLRAKLGDGYLYLHPKGEIPEGASPGQYVDPARVDDVRAEIVEWATHGGNPAPVFA